MIWREPVVVLALILPVSRGAATQCPDGSAPPCQQTRRDATTTSIVVLFFDNHSPDTADAYIAAGLTEQIANRLGQLDRFHVRTANLSQARAVPSAYVLKGALFPRPHSLRVSVEVFKSNGVRLWNADFERSAADMMALVNEISTEIASVIADRLERGDRAKLKGFPTRDVQAYDHYLRGLYLQRSRETPLLVRALREFQLAVERDSAFARAFARIGLTCGLLIRRTSPASTDSLFSQGFAATDRALVLQPRLADAWVARGHLLTLRYTPFYEGVLAAYERAMAFDPHNAEAFHFYATSLLVNYGDITRSRAAYQRAADLEPDRATSLDGLALTDFSARRFTDALRWSDSAIALGPQNSGYRITRAVIRIARGDTAGARADASAGVQTPDGSRRPALRGLIGLLDLRQGDTSSARGALEWIVSDTGDPGSERGLWAATLFLALGEREHALDYLERVRPRTGYGFPFLLSFVFLDPVRADPRFQRIVEEAHPK